MTRKVAAWAVVAAVALAVVAVGIAWSAAVVRRNNDLAYRLEAERQRNFMELIGHVQSIQGMLGKGLAAGSTRQNMHHMSEVYRRTSLATANFMSLPLPGPLSASTGKFLNQVGDFANSIARSEAAGRRMDANQRADLRRLYQEATTLSGALRDTGRRAAQETFRWVEPAPRVADALMFWRRPSPPASPGQPDQDQSVKSFLPGGMDQIGEQMGQMPVLIYDGPFSDHLEGRRPQMGGEPVDEAGARERALFFLPDAGRYQVTQVATREGVPAVFSVRLSPAGADAYNAVVDVTREGGHLASLVNARPAGTAQLDLTQAREAGRRYLDEHGFPDMEATYGEAVDGFATVQYARNHRGAIIYPDQIKVRVALDTGEVVGVDARQYVMNHRDRGALPTPAISREEAARALNPDLEVSRVRLAVIPTEVGDGELLTYEFLGRLGDDQFLVYVNAETGDEERILQLLTTPNGTLTL